MDWDKDEKVIDAKRLSLKEEYKDWKDDPNDCDYARGWSKGMTIAQLFKLLPPGIDHNDLHIDLGLENSESCESPMLHGISVGWVVTLTEEEREQIRKDDEERYQKALVKYEEDFLKYKEAMIAYHNDLITYERVTLPAWAENLNEYDKQLYKQNRL